MGTDDNERMAEMTRQESALLTRAVLSSIADEFGASAIRNLPEWFADDLRITIGASLERAWRDGHAAEVDRSIKHSQAMMGNLLTALLDRADAS